MKKMLFGVAFIIAFSLALFAQSSLKAAMANGKKVYEKNCLTCNAAPPGLKSSIVKNLAVSFCKVAEEGIEKRLQKKSKAEE